MVIKSKPKTCKRCKWVVKQLPLYRTEKPPYICCNIKSKLHGTEVNQNADKCPEFELYGRFLETVDDSHLTLKGGKNA